MRPLLPAIVAAAALLCPAPARAAAMVTNTPVDRNDVPLGTDANPFVTRGVTTAAGGLTAFSRIPSSAASSNVTLAKATAARAYTYQGCNTTATTVYMRLYNAASTGAVTPGTTPVYAGPYAFPANTCIQSTDFANNLGISAPAGLVYAFGTAPADTDATAITAGAITAFQIGYQ